QLPGKDLGVLGGMEGIVGRAAEKMRRLMEEDLCTLRRCLNDLAAAVEAFGSALLPVCRPPQMPPPLHAPDATAASLAEPELAVAAPFTSGAQLATLAASPPAATAAVTAPAPAPAPSPMSSQFRTASAASVSPSLSAALWDAHMAWEEAWQERHMYPEEPIFTALHLSVFERWAGDVANMFHKELLVKRLILSSLNAAVSLEATTNTPITTARSPLRLPLNIPPLCLPCTGPPPAAVPAPRPATAAAHASTEVFTEAVEGRVRTAGADGDAATSQCEREDSSKTPEAREEAAEREAVGCLQGEGMGISGRDTEAVINGESEGGGREGRGQGGSILLDGQNVWKRQAWTEGQAWAQGFGAAEGFEWVVMQQRLEQSGLLARPPTPQQLQVCLVAWLVEMHVDSRHLSSIFAAVDEEVKSAAA
ncbi:unnamed protein product, partial [Closterium sp. Yama58-4]